MLRYLTLRNFRAFKQQKFEFARINVFVGPNNSGKSSIISAINLLAQTARDNDANVPLVLRGRFDDLGTFQDVVHGNNPNTPLSLEFGIGKFSYHIDYKYRSQRREIEIAKYSLSDDDGQIFEYTLGPKETYKLRYEYRLFENVVPGTTKRRPAFLGLDVYDHNISLIRFSDKEKDIPEATKKFLTKIDNSIRQSQRLLTNTFRYFDSLSPFREPPTRTFLFSGASPGNVGRTGANAIDMLVSDNFRRGREKVRLIENVSRWFASTKMSRGIKVKALTSRHYEICVVGHDGRDHNICDVGFGCSQVLPVLIGALNIGNMMSFRAFTESNPIYIVQEPEIHLHPDAQAELGTFFVNLFKDSGQVFIETHSSNLIIRLQRHVAAGDISAKDLRIFYVSSGEVPPTVSVVNVNDSGFFEGNWPGGFFPQRQEESLALARAAAKKSQ
jgi:predicted ATPase